MASMRQTYILVADALRSARDASHSDARIAGVDAAAQSIAHAFAIRDQCFDRVLFLRNAGQLAQRGSMLRDTGDPFDGNATSQYPSIHNWPRK